MKRVIEEIKLVRKIHSILNVLAICYLLFANGSDPILKLNSL